MSRWFCFGKKDFCDDIENCRFCKFADGAGSVSEDEIGLILSRIFGDDYDLNRLKKLTEADRDGRCIVLPCKVGDKVYCIQSYFNDAKMRSEKKVKCRVVDFVQLFPVLFECKGMIYKLDDVGKAVFLTREEADAALGKMKERDKAWNLKNFAKNI